MLGSIPIGLYLKQNVTTGPPMSAVFKEVDGSLTVDWPNLSTGRASIQASSLVRIVLTELDDLVPFSIVRALSVAQAPVAGSRHGVAYA